MTDIGHDDGLLTVKETAKLLGISERKLHDLYEIPRVRIGRSVRFDRRDLLEFIANNKAVKECKNV